MEVPERCSGVMLSFNIRIIKKLFLQSPLLSFQPISAVIPHRTDDLTAAFSSNIFHVLKTAIMSPLAFTSVVLSAFCREISVLKSFDHFRCFSLDLRFPRIL